MSVPGVNLQTAATFMACVGDIDRFPEPRKLVSYLGLDPRVRQSGQEPARHGHISKEGAAEARHMLCEAAWIVLRYPRPLRAFGERIKARRGAGIATVAVARKLVVLFWHLLTKEQDLRLRPAEPDPQEAAPARARRRRRAGPGPARRLGRQQGAARGRARTRPARPKPPTAASSATGSQTRARARHRDAHLQSRRAASSAAGHRSQTLRLSSSSPAPPTTLARSAQTVQPRLDSHPSREAQLAAGVSPRLDGSTPAPPLSATVALSLVRVATADVTRDRCHGSSTAGKHHLMQ
jgi:hypothetical protein